MKKGTDLGELLDSDDLVDTVKVRDDIEPHLGALVLQLIEEQWQKVLDGTTKGGNFK